jgi:hypothetical protein
LDKEIKQYAYGITITESDKAFGTASIGDGQFDIEFSTGLLKYDHFGTIVRVVLHEIAHCWQLGRGISDANEREFLSRYTSVFSEGLPEANDYWNKKWVEEAIEYYKEFNVNQKKKYKDLYKKLNNY